MNTRTIFPAVFFTAILFVFSSCDRDERVTGVTLNRNTLELTVGSSETLIAAVQPANASNRAVTWASSDSNTASVNNGTITAVSVGTATITVTTADGGKTADAVVTVIAPPNQTDPGVEINGIVWATRNVDAPGTFTDNPEDAGMLYQFNRRIGWSSTNPMTDSNGGTTWDSSIPAGTAWYAENDPCPAGWRVPTQAELSNLRNQPNTWVSNWNDTGINGRLFGTAPNQIFLPAAGWRGTAGTLDDVGSSGHCWSSMQFDSTRAMGLSFGSSFSGMTAWGRANGLSVRCVAE